MKILIIDENGVREFIPSTPNQNDNSQKKITFDSFPDVLNLNQQTEKEDAPKIYTISKLVSLFETTRPTIYSWIKKGMLTPIKLGGRVYFSHKNIEELLIKKSK